MAQEIKTGQTYEIIANHVRHGFKIGDKVIIVRQQPKNDDSYLAENILDREDWWWVVQGDLKEIKTNNNMKNEINIGDMVEVVSSKHIKHWLEVPQKVKVLHVYGNDYGNITICVKGKHCDSNKIIDQAIHIKDIKLIKDKTNNMTQTTQTQKIEQVAKDLAVANNTVTTLEIKTELRKRFSNEKWFQSDISDVMDDLNNESKFSYTDNGTYRVYSLVKTAKTTPTPKTIKNMPTTQPKTVQSKVIKKVSRTKALDLIKETNGKFFGVTFTKKDNTERKMRCRTYQDTKPSALGYVLVVDTEESKPKSLNLQTISELRMNKKVYKIS